MTKQTLALILMIFSSLAAEARLRLVEWHTASTLAPVILPVRDGESPEQASQRYLKNLRQNPELMELFQGQEPQLETLAFKELDPRYRENSVLLMANLPKDTSKSSVRVEKFKYYFQKNQQRSYILPINSNLGLNLSETRELLQEINEKFPFLVVMGGDDVDPALYKKENFHSRNIIPARDRFEASVIKSYVTAEKGFLLGICRGSQITSIALGYEMIQDIPFHIEKSMAHGNDWHDIELIPTKNGLLRKALGGGEKAFVNSLHHQSVKFKEGGPLEIAARAQDGVTEATEFKNGRGLLLQFHPELMENNLGFRILSNVVNLKNQAIPRTCSHIFLN